MAGATVVTFALEAAASALVTELSKSGAVTKVVNSASKLFDNVLSFIGNDDKERIEPSHSDAVYSAQVVGSAICKLAGIEKSNMKTKDQIRNMTKKEGRQYLLAIQGDISNAYESLSSILAETDSTLRTAHLQAMGMRAKEHSALIIDLIQSSEMPEAKGASVTSTLEVEEKSEYRYEMARMLKAMKKMKPNQNDSNKGNKNVKTVRALSLLGGYGVNTTPNALTASSAYIQYCDTVNFDGVVLPGAVTLASQTVCDSAAVDFKTIDESTSSDAVRKAAIADAQELCEALSTAKDFRGWSGQWNGQIEPTIYVTDMIDADLTNASRHFNYPEGAIMNSSESLTFTNGEKSFSYKLPYKALVPSIGGDSANPSCSREIQWDGFVPVYVSSVMHDNGTNGDGERAPNRGDFSDLKFIYMVVELQGVKGKDVFGELQTSSTSLKILAVQEKICKPEAVHWSPAMTGNPGVLLNNLNRLAHVIYQLPINFEVSTADASAIGVIMFPLPNQVPCRAFRKGITSMWNDNAIYSPRYNFVTGKPTDFNTVNGGGARLNNSVRGGSEPNIEITITDGLNKDCNDTIKCMVNTPNGIVLEELNGSMISSRYLGNLTLVGTARDTNGNYVSTGGVGDLEGYIRSFLPSHDVWLAFKRAVSVQMGIELPDTAEAFSLSGDYPTETFANYTAYWKHLEKFALDGSWITS